MSATTTLYHQLSETSPSLQSELQGLAEERLPTDDLENATLAEEAIKPEKPFPLMDLPPELRNMVYEQVAMDNVATLSDRMNLEDTSSLLKTCCQIREENSSLLNATRRDHHCQRHQLQLRTC